MKLLNKFAAKVLSIVVYILILTPLLLNSANLFAIALTPTPTPISAHYAALGLATDATDAQIKAAFKELARKWHPDRLLTLTAEEQAIQRAKWFEIAEAWNVLKNQTKKTQSKAGESEIDRLLNMAKKIKANSAKGMDILLQLTKSTARDIDRAVSLGQITEAKALLAELNGIARDASIISDSTSSASDARIISEIRELLRSATAKIAKLAAGIGR